MKHETLSHLNFEALKYVLKLLEIENGLILSSSLNISELDPNKKIIKICKSLNSNVYLAGKGGLNYMNTELFTENSINIVWQKFNPLEFKYIQNKNEFTPGLSILDALFSIGAYQTKKLILNA